ncbi:peptidase C39 family protein [Pseudomonas sp. LS44]|uniref:peptidase C39 family protein n=1 Tax=Pseudomonas sp. LS44 TaxID=1357074 RepID=UPI00215AE2A1|nr:peptidase C39 family protein [Pseudomonas sp. LS44]UVE19398.1 peptidase C39 family protein [Pseudomonas sp. LS44]
MFNISRGSFSCLRFFLIAGVLGGCQGAIYLPTDLGRLPERVELIGVPFFSETAYEGAPGSLAVMLSQQGVVTTPGLVAKELGLPDAEPQLLVNIQRVAHEQGFIVYPLRTSLEILGQVAGGSPVLVQLNQGIGWVKKPHYAVIVGYDRLRQTFLLRSGSSKRQILKFSTFDSAWKDAGGWAVLVQLPTSLPSKVDPQRWRLAADGLDLAGQPQAATLARQVLSRAAPH